MSNVVKGRFMTVLDLEADELLEENKGNFETMMIIGFGPHGGMIKTVSTTADLEKMNMMLDLAKRAVVHCEYQQCERQQEAIDAGKYDEPEDEEEAANNIATLMQKPAPWDPPEVIPEPESILDVLDELVTE